MKSRPLARAAGVPLLMTMALLGLLAACAGAEGPTWTFAPLGPTSSPGGSPGGSPAGSPGGSPAGSPGGSHGGSPGGAALQVSTPADQQLAFVPNQLSAPASTEVTLTYTNESNLPHNVHVFSGQDASAPSLAATDIITGPGATVSATFTTPAEAGGYYFHCDVHPNMTGTLNVGQ